MKFTICSPLVIDYLIIIMGNTTTTESKNAVQYVASKELTGVLNVIAKVVNDGDTTKSVTLNNGELLQLITMFKSLKIIPEGQFNVTNQRVADVLIKSGLLGLSPGMIMSTDNSSSAVSLAHTNSNGCAVNVNSTTGAITFSMSQDLQVSASPAFANVKVRVNGDNAMIFQNSDGSADIARIRYNNGSGSGSNGFHLQFNEEKMGWLDAVYHDGSKLWARGGIQTDGNVSAAGFYSSGNIAADANVTAYSGQFGECKVAGDHVATKAGANAFTGNNTHAGTETFNAAVTFNSSVTVAGDPFATKAGANAFTGNNTHAGTETFNAAATFNSSVTVAGAAPVEVKGNFQGAMPTTAGSVWVSKTKDGSRQVLLQVNASGNGTSASTGAITFSTALASEYRPATTIDTQFSVIANNTTVIGILRINTNGTLQWWQYPSFNNFNTSQLNGIATDTAMWIAAS